MISAVILTENEEKNIEECIKSVSWCSEIIVIDDYSKDSTVKIAGECGAKVFQRALNGDFAQQRNIGISKAKGDWILFIDADERVSPELGKEILNATFFSDPESICNISLKRVDFLWGRELRYGEVRNVNLIRLVKKGTGTWKRRVHEYWIGTGDTFVLSNPLLHYPHQTLREFIEGIDFYSTLHAQQKYEEGERSNLVKILLWPKLKFINNWIFNFGFLDGTAGFIHATLMSFHSFLAWSKLWLMQREVN